MAPMSGHDLIFIEASASGGEALPRLVGRRPNGLPPSVFVVLHAPFQGPDDLPQLIKANAPLYAANNVKADAIVIKSCKTPDGASSRWNHGFPRLPRWGIN